jgi:hypothetical protein
MKTCTCCGVEKPLSEFHKRAKAVDGHQRVCKTCNCAQRKAYYKTERGRLQAAGYARAWAEANRARIWEFFSTHPCVDCGETDPLVLEADHIDMATKLYAISDIWKNHRWETIAAELAKCEVRCANCHRRRTVIQLGWWKNYRPEILAPLAQR